MRLLFVLTFVACSLIGCATTRRDLDRTVADFDDARYEAAREWLVMLEPKLGGMTPDERADYTYLRGITELRLGQRDDGFHWLRLAKIASADPHAHLRGEWQRVLDRTLAELTPETATYHANTAASAAPPAGGNGGHE